MERFYHCTSWAPENLPLNAELTTTTTESAYWQHKVSTAQSMAKMQPDPNVREMFSPLVRTLSGIVGCVQGADEETREYLRALPQTIGVLLEFGARRAEMAKELIFEQVRAAEYPHCPTRQRCMYMFDSSIEPGAYRQHVNLQKSLRPHLVELEIVNGVVHRAPLSALNCNGLGYQEIVEAAHRYWTPVNAPSLDVEVLFIGSFRVLRVVDEP